MSCKSGCDAPRKGATCASRMSDGRAFTDYRPRCAVNAELYNKIKGANMVASSYESRIYLQQNAEALMQENFQASMSTLLPCAPCPRPFSDPGTELPAQYVVKCDAVACERTLVIPHGLGDARSYR